MKKLSLMFLILISVLCYAQDLQPIPELSRRVTDLTSTLMTWEVDTLEKMLYEFEKEKGSQIVLLIIPTTNPEVIEEYSIRVAEKWKIGREEIDDGVIFIVAINDRSLRIEVGYGLEGILPDATAKYIIDNYILPNFRNGNYYIGIETGIELIISTIKEEPLPAPQIDESEYENYDFEVFNVPLFVILLTIFMLIGIVSPFILGQIWGRISSTLVAITVGLIFFDIFIGFILGFVNLFMSIFSLPVKANYSGSSYHSSSSTNDYSSNYSSSSYSDSSSSSGSDYSSFSGGGGSFGGGGASGSW
ncbi:MAG: YgcG family protein [Ignavibacteriales bacterium]|nr:YgcG family protein [Ignavibacteriales bacterium]